MFSEDFLDALACDESDTEVDEPVPFSEPIAPVRVNSGTKLLDLPDELLAPIFQLFAPIVRFQRPVPPPPHGIAAYEVVHLGDRAALCSLAQVSRRIHNLATPILYRDLVCLKSDYLKPHQKPHEFAAGLLYCLSLALQRSDTSAFATARSVSVRYHAPISARGAGVGDDVRRLIAACSGLRILQLRGLEALRILDITGIPLALPELDRLDITAGPSAKTASAPVNFAAGLQLAAIRTLVLSSCEISSEAFLRHSGMWLGLETLALMAPVSTEDLRIDFSRLPALRFLILDGAAHPDLTATSSLLDGQRPQVMELGVSLYNVEDGWGILNAVTRGANGFGKLETINLKLDAIQNRLGFSESINRDERMRREGLAYRLSQFLDKLLEASQTFPFRLQPQQYPMDYDRYLQTARQVYDAPWGRCY